MRDSDIKKVKDLSLISNFLSKKFKSLNMYALGGGLSYACIENEHKGRNDIAGLLLSANTGKKLATKYDMVPGTELWKHIESLSLVAKKNEEYSPRQARQVLFVFYIAIFYGIYEFLKDLDNKKEFTFFEKKAMEMMSNDADYMRKNIVETLSKMDTDDAEILDEIYGGLHKRFENYTSNTGFTEDIATIQQRYHWGYLERTDWYSLIKMLSEKSMNLTDVVRGMTYCVFGQGSSMPYDVTHYCNHWGAENVLPLVSKLKSLGDEYVIAPAMNLYINTVLNLKDRYLERKIQRYKKEQQEQEKRATQLARYYDMLNPSAEFMNMLREKKR